MLLSALSSSVGGSRSAATALVAATYAFCAGSQPALAQGVVNVYSYREPALIAPLIEAFTAQTKIKVNLVYAADGLAERMEAEAANSPADVLLTVDIVRLADAKSKGITQPIASGVLNAAIPASYRDPEGHWFALTQRARVVYASKERVAQNVITYEELAEPKWNGKICTRSGQHTYNVGLLASMIAHHGAEKAEAWIRGVKANLGRKPAGGDREQVRDVKAGLCDIAIGNTYYMAAMQTGNAEQQSWAVAVKILFPNAEGRGTHVNVSGALLGKNAPNKANGIKLIEFLASDDGQRIYAGWVNEYPLKAGIAISERVKSWGALKADPLPLAKVAEYRRKASELMDKVGFDQGP